VSILSGYIFIPDEPKMALRARKGHGVFEKQAPAVDQNPEINMGQSLKRLD